MIENVAGETWRSDVCPRWVVTERSAYLLTLNRFWQTGKLAVAGGVLDQPNAYVEAMNIIDNRLAIITAERQRAAEKRQAKR